ncbi:hypothetical protein BDZ89DRAFT_1113774 [Hymenopellis radicata]|nr:hypothetical protein BDZ89DRAFT_1113774 [Hymenopellis radicata]
MSAASEPRLPSPPDNDVSYKGQWEPEFPPPACVDITKRASVVQYCQKLADDEIKAHLQPLHVGWSFEAEIEPHFRVGNGPPKGYRHVPLPLQILRKKAFRFELNRALQPYVPRNQRDPGAGPQWSQVWVAALTDCEIADAEPIGVVLKIIQPSLLPHPIDDDEKLRYYRFPGHIANTEHVLYRDALADVQGKAVPYYFGKTKVLMPNGEEAHVLIFEGIGGETMKSWVQKFIAASTAEQTDLMTALPCIAMRIATSYSLLGDCHVLHRDVCLQNMILTVSGHIVIVDFAGSVLHVSRKTLEDEKEGWHAGSFVIGQCRRTYPSFKTWAANEGKATISRFRMEGWDTD